MSESFFTAGNQVTDQFTSGKPGSYPVMQMLADRDSELADGIVALGSYAAGDDLLISADTERSTTSGSYVILKQIRISKGGTLRIKFDLKGAGAGSGYGKIYRNGVAVGTEQIDGDETYSTYSEDIAGWTAGDTIDLYVHQAGGGGTAYVRNFRIYALNLDAVLTD